FARRRIRQGEIVAIKGGHVYDARTLAKVKARIAVSYIQIAHRFFIGARAAAGVARNKIFITHSGARNPGTPGQRLPAPLGEIGGGEELTYDWAMEEHRSSRTLCRCGARRCRRVLTGQDWMLPRLQRRYRGYFSPYLGEKTRHAKR